MAEAEVTGVAYFNDPSHLNNFLNYLFRTDKKQKWTNDRTNADLEFYEYRGYDGNHYVTYDRLEDDLDERTNRKKTRHREMAQKFGVSNVMTLPVGPFENFIIYVDEVDGLFECADAVFENVKKQDRWEIDTVVAHVDQANGLHLHVVGHLKQGLRRRTDEELCDIMFDE